MSSPAYSLIHFKDGTPAPLAGQRNVKWQQSAPYSASAVVNGQTVNVSAIDVSAYEPNLGGVDSQAGAAYTTLAADQGQLIVLTNAAAVALTLDSTLPNNFLCGVLFLGAAGGTITPSAGTINAKASISLPQGTGGLLFFNGTNWWLIQDLAYLAKILQTQQYIYAVDTGVANAYVVTLAPAPAAYVAGMIVMMKAAHANTGASTINVNGLGLVNITKTGAVALTGGEIALNQIIPLVHDGTEFQIVGGGGGGSFTAGGDLSGTAVSQEVIGILNKAIDGTVPADGQILQYSSTTGKWELLVDRPIFPVSALVGKPSAGQLVCIYTAAAAMTFPANFASPNSYGTVGNNPVATAGYSIYKNGVLVGNISISTAGVFTFTTVGGTPFSLNAADRLTIVAPGAQDAQLSDVGITLVGTRTATVPAVLSQGIFTFRGAYAGGTTYGANDVVSYQGGLYLAKGATTGNVPTNTTFWSLLVGYEWNFTGAWSSITAYNPNDVVTLSGATYLCILGNTNFTPPNATYWSLLAAAGASSSASAIQQEQYVYATDTGTANAYAISQSPAPTIVAGSFAILKAANANTGASTLAVNGGAATPIKKSGGTALASGDIAAGQIIPVAYDGTNWQIIGGGGGGDITAKYIIGATDAVLTNALVWPGLYNHPDAPPASAGSLDDEFDAASLNTTTRWTWRNQSTSTATLSKSILTITPPNAAGERVIYQTAPATPWRVVAKMAVAGVLANQNLWAGLCAFDSGSTNLVDFAWYTFSSDGLAVQHMTGDAAYGSTPKTNQIFSGQVMPWMYLMMGDDGTNLYVGYSLDGVNFTQIYHELRKSFLTVNGPDRVGIVVDNWAPLTDDAAKAMPILSVDFFRRTI